MGARRRIGEKDGHHRNSAATGGGGGGISKKKKVKGTPIRKKQGGKRTNGKARGKWRSRWEKGGRDKQSQEDYCGAKRGAHLTVKQISRKKKNRPKKVVGVKKIGGERT